MKLSDIKATKDKPTYVNLRPDGLNGGGFAGSLKWDGESLFIFNSIGIWSKPRKDYHIYDNDMNSNNWYICRD